VRFASGICLGFAGGAAIISFIFIAVINQEHDSGFAAAKAAAVFGLAFALILLSAIVLLDLAAVLMISGRASRDFWDLEQCRELQFDGSVKQVVAAFAFLVTERHEQEITATKDNPPSQSYALAAPQVFSIVKKILQTVRYEDRRWNIFSIEKASYTLTAVSFMFYGAFSRAKHLWKRE
jgi:hypothetical protein